MGQGSPTQVTITQYLEAEELLDELKDYVGAGYAAPSDIFRSRLDRLMVLLDQSDVFTETAKK